MSVVVLSAAPCLAEVRTVASSTTEAKAKAEGKLILGDFGQKFGRRPLTGCPGWDISSG
jgi:hypothetical protein